MSKTHLTNENFRVKQNLKLLNLLQKLSLELNKLKWCTTIKKDSLYVYTKDKFTVVAQCKDRSRFCYFSPDSISRSCKGVAVAIDKKLRKE